MLLVQGNYVDLYVHLLLYPLIMLLAHPGWRHTLEILRANANDRSTHYSLNWKRDSTK